MFFGVSQAHRQGILPRRLHLLQAPRDVRNQTRRLVCRSVALVIVVALISGTC